MQLSIVSTVCRQLFPLGMLVYYTTGESYITLFLRKNSILIFCFYFQWCVILYGLPAQFFSRHQLTSQSLWDLFDCMIKAIPVHVHFHCEILGGKRLYLKHFFFLYKHIIFLSDILCDLHKIHSSMSETNLTFTVKSPYHIKYCQSSINTHTMKLYLPNTI